MGKVVKQTAVVAAKVDAGTDVNFTISGFTITHSTGLPVGLDEQGALSSSAAALHTTPGAGTSHEVGEINLMNSGANTRIISMYDPEDGTTFSAATLWATITLLANEHAIWTPGGGWVQYDANGRELGVTLAATQTDQESASSLVTFVAPGTQQFHPSACKAWGEFGVAADITASYNITSLTDTGTGVIGVTIATDMSSTAYCVVPGVEATGTTWAVANSREVHVRNATLAAGSFSMDCIDNTVTTNLVKDPTHWFAACFGDQ